MITRTTGRAGWHLLGAALAAALLVGCSTGAPAAPPQATAATSAATAPDSAATAYLLQTPEFSVGLPEEPVQQTQDIPEVPGATVLSYAVDGGRYAVVVGIVDYPAAVPLADPTTVLEGARDGAIANVPGASLTSSTPTTVDGRPALDLVATGADDLTYLARLVLDDRRLYQLATVGDVDRKAEHSELVASLRLLT